MYRSNPLIGKSITKTLPIKLGVLLACAETSRRACLAFSALTSGEVEGKLRFSSPSVTY
jgi:hypothetical protein